MNHLNDVLSEQQSPAFGKPQPKARLTIHDPWNDSMAPMVLHHWLLQARMRQQMMPVTGDQAVEYSLRDERGNTKIINPVIDYTMADLYAADGTLLP